MDLDLAAELRAELLRLASSGELHRETILDALRGPGTPGVLYRHDGERITWASDEALQVFGQDLVGRPLLDIMDPQSHPQVRGELARGSAGTSVRSMVGRGGHFLVVACFEPLGGGAWQCAIRPVASPATSLLAHAS